MLAQFREYLQKNGVADNHIIAINFEDLKNHRLLDYQVLYDHLLEKISENSHKSHNSRKTQQSTPTTQFYIFLDEIQNVPQFQRVVDSLFIQDNVDLYITGSNAYLLSGELATLLSGRYIEIQMLPLSFAEYYRLTQKSQEAAWQEYLLTGGFPYIALLEDKELQKEYISGIYHTVLLKDIVARKQITQVPILESVIQFLFDNIGNIVSPKKIADTLTSYHKKTNSVTVENYIQSLRDSFLLYKASRYDIKGKQYLQSLEKYYLVDVGLRRILAKDQHADIGRLLENIVYLELIRRGYSVSIGKIGPLEVDFVAASAADRAYYQVAATVLDASTFQREVRSLQRIEDNYPKYIISMDSFPINQNGIKHINIIDFLLEPW